MKQMHPLHLLSDLQPLPRFQMLVVQVLSELGLFSGQLGEKKHRPSHQSLFLLSFLGQHCSAGSGHHDFEWSAQCSERREYDAAWELVCKVLCCLASSLSGNNDNSDNSDGASSIDYAVRTRRACKIFQRSDWTPRNGTIASASNPSVVQAAKECLDLARYTPSGFNTQPYRVVLVHSREQKEALSRYCLGPNQQRVLDSDCTVVFLADRQCLKTREQYRAFAQQADKKGRPLPRRTLLYWAIFSSGLPWPRVVSAMVTFAMRTILGCVDTCCQLWGAATRQFGRKPQPQGTFLPTLSSADTWSSKHASMVAMTYMLACASRKLDTSPMEGINARGIRRVLGVPHNGRYAIPLVVSTGRKEETAAQTKVASEENRERIRRYPLDEMVFEDSFGS